MRPVERVDMNREELEALLDRAIAASLSEEDYAKLKGVVETLGYLTHLLEDRKTAIQKLRQLLFGAGTEKTANLLKTDAQHAQTDVIRDSRATRKFGNGPRHIRFSFRNFGKDPAKWRLSEQY